MNNSLVKLLNDLYASFELATDSEYIIQIGHKVRDLLNSIEDENEKKTVEFWLEADISKKYYELLGKE